MVTSLPFCLLRTKTVVSPSLAFFSLRADCTIAHCLLFCAWSPALVLPPDSHWILQSPCVAMT